MRVLRALTFLVSVGMGDHFESATEWSEYLQTIVEKHVGIRGISSNALRLLSLRTWNHQKKTIICDWERVPHMPCAITSGSCQIRHGYIRWRLTAGFSLGFSVSHYQQSVSQKNMESLYCKPGRWAKISRRWSKYEKWISICFSLFIENQIGNALCRSRDLGIDRSSPQRMSLAITDKIYLIDLQIKCQDQ